MSAFDAMAQVRLGELVGGDEGKALVGKGHGTLRAQGVMNVDALVAMYLPRVC